MLTTLKHETSGILHGIIFSCPCIEAYWTSAKPCNKKSGPQHRCILHKLGHLNLMFSWLIKFPEGMHHKYYGNQKCDKQPRCPLSFVTEENAEASLAQPQALPSFDEQEISGAKIQKRDLPEAVRESLKAPDYAGWKVESAYKALVTDRESPESTGLLIYIVKLRRKQEKEMIKFDKEGKRLY